MSNSPYTDVLRLQLDSLKAVAENTLTVIDTPEYKLPEIAAEALLFISASIHDLSEAARIVDQSALSYLASTNDSRVTWLERSKHFAVFMLNATGEDLDSLIDKLKKTKEARYEN